MLLSLTGRSPHIEVAHEIWKECLKPGAFVLDATAGNGHDTAFIAPLIFPGGRLIALDIQKEALEKGERLLEGKYPVEWILESHDTFPEKLPDGCLDLVIYNLGYLPGSDKGCITQPETTEKSLLSVLNKLKEGGLLSITTYSGHVGGEVEEEVVENLVSRLERRAFGVASFSWPNRPKAPKLFIAKKAPQLEPLEKGHYSRQ